MSNIYLQKINLDVIEFTIAALDSHELVELTNSFFMIKFEQKLNLNIMRKLIQSSIQNYRVIQ